MIGSKSRIEGMAKYKKSDFKSAIDRIRELPEDRLRKVEAGASRILEQMHLAEIRKALDTTQMELSARTNMKQAEISRVEHNAETMQLRTLQRYIVGLGGELQIVARFPDGVSAEIPLKAGKPVKSRIKIETTPPAE
jgi:hypothetical protein